MKRKNPPLTIAVTNDKELAYAADLIEGTLISVASYLKNNPKKSFRIDLPYERKIKTTLLKRGLFWIPSRKMAQKISSQFAYLEFLKWLDKHSRFPSLERSLLYKDIIIFSTSICESIATIACDVANINKERYKDRLNSLKRHGFISSELNEALKHQWDLRSRVHLHLSTQEEAYSKKEAMSSVGVAVKILFSVTKRFEEINIAVAERS